MNKGCLSYKFNIPKNIIVREFVICATSYIYDFKKYTLQVDNIPLNDIFHEMLLVHDSFRNYGNKVMFPKEDPPYKKFVRAFSIPVEMFVGMETMDTTYSSFSLTIDLHNPIEDLSVRCGYINKAEYEKGLMGYQFVKLDQEIVNIGLVEEDESLEDFIISVTI